MNKQLLTITVFCLFLISACKKAEKAIDPPANSPTILQLSVKEAAPYSFIDILFPIGAKPLEDNNSKVIFSFGDTLLVGIPIKLDSLEKLLGVEKYYAYQVFVPKLKQGKLIITHKDQKETMFSSELLIKDFSVQVSPSIYHQSFVAFIGLKNSEIKARYDLAVIAGTLDSKIATSLKNSLDSSLLGLSQQLSGMSIQDQLIYVNLLENNKGLLNLYFSNLEKNPMQILKKKAGGDPCAYERIRNNDLNSYFKYKPEGESRQLALDQCDANNQRMGQEITNQNLGIIYNANQQAIEAYNNASTFYAIRAYIKTFASATITGVKEEITKLTLFDEKVFAIESIEELNKSSMIDFENNKETEFSTRVRITNLNNQSNINSPSYTSFLGGVTKFNSLLLDLASFLPGLNPVDLNIKNTTIIRLTNFEIDAISNSNIKVVLKKLDTCMMVKFISSIPINENVEFSFRIRVVSDFGTIEKTINATLKPVELPIIGLWHNGSSEVFGSINSSTGIITPIGTVGDLMWWSNQSIVADSFLYVIGWPNTSPTDYYLYKCNLNSGALLQRTKIASSYTISGWFNNNIVVSWWNDNLKVQHFGLINVVNGSLTTLGTVGNLYYWSNQSYINGNTLYVSGMDSKNDSYLYTCDLNTGNFLSKVSIQPNLYLSYFTNNALGVIWWNGSAEKFGTLNTTNGAISPSGTISGLKYWSGANTFNSNMLYVIGQGDLTTSSFLYKYNIGNSQLVSTALVPNNISLARRK